MPPRIAPRSRDRADTRWPFAVAFTFAVLAHVALFFVLREWTRVQPGGAPRQRDVMHLRLISEPVAPVVTVPVPQDPLPGKPQAQSAARVPSERTTEPEVPPRRVAVQPASSTRVPAATPDTPGVKLYKRDGSLDLPALPTDPDPASFGSRKRIAAYTPDPMRHQVPLPYVPTMFDRDWDAQDDEPALIELLKNAMIEKSWDTQGGTRITCGVLIILGGCSWGWTPRVTIEELKRMRADPPMPRRPITPVDPPIPQDSPPPADSLPR